MASSKAQVPLSDALRHRVIRQGSYAFTLPHSFCYGPRVFGGLVLAMVHHAARDHFQKVHSALQQPDVLNIQVQFLRLLFPSEAIVTIEDVHLGKSGSTLQFTVTQNGSRCIVGYLNMADLTINGVSFKTNWDLTPAPIEASISKLASDEDPRWISYQTPYHEDTFRRAQSYLKQYVPLELQDPSFLDQWITPSDPQATFTNDDIAFVADISLPILDNYFPGFCTGSHANTIACGLQQKADRENGINRVPDVSSGSYESKAMIMTLASTIEIKKRLPENGVRWLFMRAQAKQIKGGKLSMEVSVLDENGDLVALSSQVLPIIDLERQKRNKQKI